MSHWVRLWEDMPNDPKWRVVARRANSSFSDHALLCVTVRDVVTVFVHMLINAGNGENRGVLENWNDEVVASAIDAEPELVTSIREAMDGLVLDGFRIKAWEKRQPNREDSSTERMRALRARRNAVKHTETTTKRNVTRCDAPDTDKIREDKSRVESARGRARPDSTQKDLKTSISEDATPNSQQMADADKFGLNTEEAVEAEFERFRDYNRAKGVTLADWDAAWRNWLGKVGEFKPKKSAKRMNGHANHYARSGQIFVKEGTPQWNAWDLWWKMSNGVAPPKDTTNPSRGDGWWFPTEYPPNPG